MASLLPKLNPEFSGVNPKTGEYLSPEERKQVFKLRKRKLDPSKVFDKSAIVKVDKPQANMDSVMKSIANIQETLQKLQTIIVTDAEQKKEDQKKQNRKLLMAGEKEKRKEKEGLLEKVPERLKTALLSPIKAVGEQAKGILGRLMEAFTLIFTGWLADKGFKAIQAFMSGDKEKLKSIGMNVLAGLGIVGSIFVAMNLGLLALPLIIGKVIAVIASVGAAIIGFLLSPPGLITLAIAAGIGAAIIGISKLVNFMRGGDDASAARKANREKLKESGVMKVVGDRGADVMRNGEKVFVKTEDLTDEERAAVEAFKIEDQRIKDTTSKKNQEIKDAKARIESERKPGEEKLRSEAKSKPGKKDYTALNAYTKETGRLKKEAVNKIKEKYGEIYSGSSSDGSSITPTSSNDVNISSSTTDKNLGKVNNGEPKVIVNNLQGKEQGDQPLKSGDQTNVPLIASSDSNNMYKSFSTTQYGVVV